MDDLIITSSSNRAVRRAREAARCKTQSGDVLAHGVQCVTFALRFGGGVDLVLVTPEGRANSGVVSLVRELRSVGADVRIVAPEILEGLTGSGRKASIAAIAQVIWSPLDLVISTGGPIVALHRVSSPGNLGSVIRSADAFGVRGVILLDDCCNPWEVRGIKASMGSVFRVPIARASSEDFLTAADQADIAVVGAAGGLGAALPGAFSNEDRVAVLFGSEREGLPNDLLSGCERLIQIPMVGEADSFNLAVAASIVMYELVRT